MIKIYDIETLEEREILFRGGSGADVSAPVAEILRAVQERGDAALREYTLRFDGAAPDALAVTAEEVDQAAAQVEPAFLAVLEEAVNEIRKNPRLIKVLVSPEVKERMILYRE